MGTPGTPESVSEPTPESTVDANLRVALASERVSSGTRHECSRMIQGTTEAALHLTMMLERNKKIAMYMEGDGALSPQEITTLREAVKILQNIHERVGQSLEDVREPM